MKNILIIDTETTGLDHKTGSVLEIAAILFNIKTKSIIHQISTLLYAESNPAFEVNRINVDSLKAVNLEIQARSISLIEDMMIHSDAIVAHNAEFDKKWIELIPNLQVISRNRKWICTRNDVKWPIRKGIPLNLIHICVDLGIPVVNAHRALSDCQLLVSALSTIDDLEYFLDKSGSGRLIYVAEIGYSQRQLAKDMGFLWDNVKKIWYAKLTPEEAAALPFRVTNP